MRRQGGAEGLALPIEVEAGGAVTHATRVSAGAVAHIRRAMNLGAKWHAMLGMTWALFEAVEARILSRESAGGETPAFCPNGLLAPRALRLAANRCWTAPMGACGHAWWHASHGCAGSPCCLAGPAVGFP